METTECLRLVFARNIRYFRWLKKMTQEGLAQKTGHSRQWVSAVEKGKVALNLDHLECLIKALGVGTVDLVGVNDFARDLQAASNRTRVKIHRTNV